MLKRSPNQVSLVIIKRYFCIKVFLIHNFHPKPRSLWVSSFISELVLTGAEWQLSWQLTSSTCFLRTWSICNINKGKKYKLHLWKCIYLQRYQTKRKSSRLSKSFNLFLFFAASDSRRVRLSKADLDFAFFICSMTKGVYSYASISI